MHVSAIHRRDIVCRRLVMFINSSINSIIRPRLIPSIAVLFALAIQQTPIMIVLSNRNYCRNQETWFAEFITELWSGRLVLIIKLNVALHNVHARVLRKQFIVITDLREYSSRIDVAIRAYFRARPLWRSYQRGGSASWRRKHETESYPPPLPLSPVN